MALLPRSILLSLLFCPPLPADDATPDTAASATVVRQMKDWIKLLREKRPVIPDTAAQTPLTRADASTLRKALWEDHAASVKATRADEAKAKVLTHGNLKMKYETVSFGPKNGARPLFISMHGGGGAPADVNESQWVNQVKLAKAYKPSAGIYVAPRAPTNNWNLWHEGHIDALFDRLIQDMIVFENADPNKVYIMGYSAGGDGVYQLAPRMADRLAAASMMAGHPNNASPLGLRNIGFTIHVGANDGGYGRNKVAAEWGQKLDDLQKADPKGYAHFVHLHEGCSHWMNMEDKEAIPWMEKFTRNPLPEKVVWHQADTVHDRFYWLAVPKAEAKAGQDINAERNGQSISVTAKGISHVTLLLNDAMLDMDQPVTITFNGTTLPPRKVTRTVAIMQRTLEERGDPDLVFRGEIMLP